MCLFLNCNSCQDQTAVGRFGYGCGFVFAIAAKTLGPLKSVLGLQRPRKASKQYQKIKFIQN
jgi:hypothetical protein